MCEVICFFPQTATALRRNTRPSAHDAPLPVYGQGIVTTGPLPNYPAGKVSFFFPSLSKVLKKFYNLINALTALVRQYTDFRRLKFIFSLPKNRQIPVPVVCLPSLSYCRIFAFLWTQTREEGYISWSKENFFPAELPREITSGLIQNKGFTLSCLLVNSVVLQKRL